MNDIPRVLCAIDLSRPSEAAFSYSLAAAKSRAGQLDIVCAAPANRGFSWQGRERTALLARLRLTAAAAGVPVAVSVQHGEPGDVILLHAHSSNSRTPALIVLGTHGRRGIDRIRLGSIAERVMHAAPCPTLVVRAPGFDPEVARPMNRILCAVDHSPASLSALDYAVRLLADGGTTLTLLQVISPTSAALPRFAWEFVAADCVRELTETAWAKLRTLMPVEPELRGRMQVQVSVGQPAEEIGRARTKLNADVVVMGVMPRGVFGRWLGSTTSQVLRAVRCPLIAVPESFPSDRRASRDSPQTRPAAVVGQTAWGTARIA